MEKHLQPKPSELAERYKFRHRKQKEGETISEYAAIFNKMSKTCEFGSWLEESLRDQLVCGITNETIRQRLFVESNLDFRMVYKLAVSMEAAEKDAAAVEGQSGSRSEGTSTTSVTCQAKSAGSRRKGSVALATRDIRGATTPLDTTTSSGRWHGARAPSSRAQHQHCRVCGVRHDASKCKFGSYVCRVSNQGHLRRICPNLSEHYNVDMDVLQIKNSNERDGTESDAVIFVDVCKLSATRPIYIELNVNDVDV